MIQAYTIGINLAVTNNVGAAVGQINQALSGLNNTVSQISTHMRALQQIMVGHGLERAGQRILGGMADLVRAGADLNTEFTRTLMLGGQIARHAVDMRADAMAFAQRYPTADPAQFFRQERELASQVGYDEARRVTPMLSMTGANLAFMSGKPGGEHEMLDAYRTLEAVGGLYGPDHKFDEARFTRYTNSLNAALITAGGLTSMADMRQATRQAGPSLIGMPPEALFPYLSELGIQMGHSRAGTASMSFSAQMAGGIMTRRTAEGMEHAHLLNRNEYNVGRGGSVVLTPDARRRLAADTADPLKWVTERLLPATQGSSNSELISIIMGMFGRQTTQRMITDLTRNNPQFWRARENAAAQQQDQGVMGAYNAMNQGSISANLNNATTAWHGFQQAVTDAAAPELVTGLRALTDALHWLTAKAEQYPAAAKGLAAFAVALGGLLTVTGSFMVLRGTLALMGFSSVLQGFMAISGLSTLGLALRGVATGLNALASIAGLATLAGNLTAIGGALAVITGAVAGFRMSPEENQRAGEQLEQLNRARRGAPAPPALVPQDGYSIEGDRLPHREGYLVPPQRDINIRLTGSIPITADGRTIAQLTGDRLTAMLRDAPRGSISPDPSISPLWGPQVG